MSQDRIDPHTLLQALKRANDLAKRPIDAPELAQAYYGSTGQLFNSDSLTRHLKPHIDTGAVTRTRGSHRQYLYALNPHHTND